MNEEDSEIEMLSNRTSHVILAMSAAPVCYVIWTNWDQQWEAWRLWGLLVFALLTIGPALALMVYVHKNNDSDD